MLRDQQFQRPFLFGFGPELFFRPDGLRSINWDFVRRVKLLQSEVCPLQLCYVSSHRHSKIRTLEMLFDLEKQGVVITESTIVDFGEADIPRLISIQQYLSSLDAVFSPEFFADWSLVRQGISSPSARGRLFRNFVNEYTKPAENFIQALENICTKPEPFARDWL